MYMYHILLHGMHCCLLRFARGNFILMIISNLKRSFKNSTKNSHVLFTYIHLLVYMLPHLLHNLFSLAYLFPPSLPHSFPVFLSLPPHMYTLFFLSHFQCRGHCPFSPAYIGYFPNMSFFFFFNDRCAIIKIMSDATIGDLLILACPVSENPQWDGILFFILNSCKVYPLFSRCSQALNRDLVISFSCAQ